MESRVLGPEKRQVAKESELAFQAATTAKIKQLQQINDRQAFLLASHLQSVAKDWYVKRWNYKAEKVSVNEFAKEALHKSACL